MKSTETLVVTMPTAREIRMTRVFDAPRSLVFEALTKPELLKRWFFGPDGWSLAVCEIDPKVGGKYRYVWRRDSDGTEMGMSGVILEIVPPERFVGTERFDEPWYPGEAEGTTVLSRTAAEPRSSTRSVTSRKRFGTRFSGRPWSGAWPRGYDRLAGILASILAARGSRGKD